MKLKSYLFSLKCPVFFLAILLNRIALINSKFLGRGVEINELLKILAGL